MRDFQTSTFVFEGMTFNIYELFIHNMNFTRDKLIYRLGLLLQGIQGRILPVG